MWDQLIVATPHCWIQTTPIYMYRSRPYFGATNCATNDLCKKLMGMNPELGKNACTRGVLGSKIAVMGMALNVYLRQYF